MPTLTHVSEPVARRFSDNGYQPASRPQANVANWERAASGIGGGLLMLKGLDQGGLTGVGMLGLGAALVYRGMSGQCSLYRQLGISTATPTNDSFKGVKFDAQVTINKPRDEVYRRYRNFSQHPQFSNTIKSVTLLDGGRTHWIASGPMGRRLEWDAEIIEDRPGEVTSWRSTSEADVRNAGSVWFSDAPGNRGTEVQLTMSFEPPLGPAGRAIGRLLSTFPSEWAQQELMRFKRWLETGQPEGA